MLHLELVQSIKDNENLGDENFGVQDMASDLKDAVRGLHTARRCGSSMHVYRPQDTYVMGWICYADHSNTGGGEKRYSVFSPNIQNRKYQDGEKVHMSSTMHRAKGVKNAMKHLRPLTALQVLGQTKSGFLDKLAKVRDVATLAYHKAADPVRQTPFPSNTYLMERPNAIQDELQAMINSGHKFINKELEAELRVAFSARDELIDSRKLTDRKHKFVEAYTVGGDTRFRGFPNVGNHAALYGIDESTAFDYAQEELPESILGGISVLSMVQVGHYVAGVGIKHADNMFYLSEE
mgnify:FL=1|tara:strand:+ start:1848 stop:2726 length:879 start_codon:yes stop_codon:yes gene_type:complete